MKPCSSFQHDDVSLVENHKNGICRVMHAQCMYACMDVGTYGRMDAGLYVHTYLQDHNFAL